jgi:hypothetical protein
VSAIGESFHKLPSGSATPSAFSVIAIVRGTPLVDDAIVVAEATAGLAFLTRLVLASLAKHRVGYCPREALPERARRQAPDRMSSAILYQMVARFIAISSAIARNAGG